MALFTDQGVNTFQDFAFSSDENFPLISGMSFILKPQVGKELFDINPMESDWGDMMKMGLMREGLGQSIIHHESRKRFQAPVLNSSATVGNVYGTASVGNGDPAAFSGLDYVQLAQSSHTPTSGSQQYYYSYPRAGQIIEFKNGAQWRIQGKREGATYAGVNRLYITKIDSTDPALSATITLSGSTYGGDIFSVPTSAYEESTWGQQKGLIPATKKFENTYSTFSERYDVSDWQENSETYPFTLPNGQTINLWYIKGIQDTELRYNAQVDFGLFMQKASDSSTVAYDPISGTNKSLTTTQGYIPNLEANAPKVFYDDNPTIKLFETLIRLRNKLNQGYDCNMQYGREFGFRVTSLITQLGINGGMIYDRQSVDLGFNTLQLNGYRFHMKQMRILNKTDITDIPGFRYPYYFIVAPTDQTKDPKTNVMLDAFCIIYQKMVGKGARGYYKLWETGGNSPTGTDSQLMRHVHMAGRQGMQVVGASAFILGKSSTLS